MRGSISNLSGQDRSVLSGLLTRRDLSATLGVSERTLDRWHALRVGPPRIKMGQRVLYRREALEKWLLAHESVPLRQHSGL